MSTFTDTRTYTIGYPKTNIIINQAIEVSNNKLPMVDLIRTIQNLLKDTHDALINVALNLSPSYAVSSVIWHSLTQAINNIENNTQNKACLFAIPVVIVAGSKTKAQLNGEVNSTVLNNFFKDNSIVNEDVDFFISGKLIDPKTIAGFKPSQYYYWVRNIANANLWLPTNLEGNPLTIEKEGVFTRFLIGVISGVNQNLALSNILNFNNYRNCAKKLMDILVNELKSDAVTFFPIPYEPCYLSESYIIGDNHRKEIAISVALSNIIRQIRQNSLTPKVCVTMNNNILEITTTTLEKSQYQETSYWDLTQYDDLKFIQNKLFELFKDMQLSFDIM